MSELVEFIRGCLDADEQTARAILDSDARWLRLDEGPPWHCDEQSDHVAFSPARVLAEVNAKRVVVDMLADAEAVIARIGPDLDKPGDAAEWANYHAWRQAVEALARPYAGEPGWRDEWGTQ